LKGRGGNRGWGRVRAGLNNVRHSEKRKRKGCEWKGGDLQSAQRQIDERDNLKLLRGRNCNRTSKMMGERECTGGVGESRGAPGNQ